MERIPPPSVERMFSSILTHAHTRAALSWPLKHGALALLSAMSYLACHVAASLRAIAPARVSVQRLHKWPHALSDPADIGPLAILLFLAISCSSFSLPSCVLSFLSSFLP